MLSREENELLTHTGPGTPGGELLRRFWQPVALSEELPPGSEPRPVRIMGEDLVLFRDDECQPGLMGLHCPHRGADLSFGRVEGGGLRCLYHGWLFDRSGRCLDQPSEPPHSQFKQKVRHLAYPCQEAGGLIFTYMGPGDPPLLPAYEPLTISPEHICVLKCLHECNYFQANEGNLDPCHTSFLHRQLDAPPDLKRPVKGTDGKLPMHYYILDAAPEIELEETNYGLRIFSLREGKEGRSYFRVTNFIFPNMATIVGPMSGDGYNLYIHVPIDDDHHWRYDVTFRRSAPLDETDWKRFREIRAELTEDYRPIRNQRNRYLQDREAMRSWSYAGMGRIFNVQDMAIVEGQGPVVNRTEEHLGSNDKVIIGARRMVLKAIRDLQAGARATAGGSGSQGKPVRSSQGPGGSDFLIPGLERILGE